MRLSDISWAGVFFSLSQCIPTVRLCLLQDIVNNDFCNII